MSSVLRGGIAGPSIPLRGSQDEEWRKVSMKGAKHHIGALKSRHSPAWGVSPRLENAGPLALLFIRPLNIKFFHADPCNASGESKACAWRRSGMEV